MPELTPNMVRVLEALDRLRERGKYPASPNEIAMEAGFHRDVRRRGSGASGKGGWAGYMAPSQRIISTLTALDRRGLIDPTRRRDGLSGVAYRVREELPEPNGRNFGRTADDDRRLTQLQETGRVVLDHGATLADAMRLADTLAIDPATVVLRPYFGNDELEFGRVELEVRDA